MTITTRLEVLDPTVESVPAHTIIARRPETLDALPRNFASAAANKG